jgi:nicotinamidase-related amidase
MSDNKTALVVIDAQVNMSDPEYPCHDSRGVIGKLRALVDKAHAAEVPVIYILNNGPKGAIDEPHSPGWELDPDLAPEPGEPVIEKTTPDSFHETSLGAELAARNIKNLVIAGFQTDWCVQATTRQAANLGYNVTLVKDAHSTLDSDTQKATEIIADHNEQLGKVATLKDAAEVSF